MLKEKNDENLSSYNESKAIESQLKFVEKLGYGLGDLASALIFSAVTAFLTFYYTDIIGVSAAVVGTIILFSKIFDGFTDIIMGVIVDKTRSKYGKARPWLLWMAIPYTISSILLFTVPNIGPIGILIYIAVTYNLIHFVYTAINIPYGVLNARITKDSYQRSVLNIFRMFMALTGALVVMFFTIPLVETFGGGKTGWILTFTLFGVLAGGIFLVTFFSTKERVETDNVAQASVPLKTSMKALLKNKYWYILLIFALVSFGGSALHSGLGIYYAQYILEDPALVGPLGSVGLIPVMIGLLFVAPIIKKFGKRNSIIIGLVFGLLGTVVILIDPTNFILVLTGSVIRSIGGIPFAATFFAMLADAIEYGEWKTSIRIEGLIYSAGSMGTKIGTGLGGAAMGWLLAFGGYVSGTANQSDSAISMILFLFIWIPAIVAVTQIIILLFYKLDKIYPKILADLEAKNNKS